MTDEALESIINDYLNKKVVRESKNKDKQETVKKCKSCHSYFATFHGKTIYCSQACHRAYLKRKYDSTKQTNILKVVCLNCKQEFETNKDNKVYCDVTCRFNYHCKQHPVRTYTMKEREK